MAFLGETYEPKEDFGGRLYPIGEYAIKIENSETKETASGEGEYIMNTIMVLDGELAGTQIIDRINFKNPNPQTVEIARKTMGQLAHVIDRQLSDTDQLVGLECVLKITMYEDKKTKEPKNSFKYLRKDGGEQAFTTASKPAASSGGGAPWKKAANG